jgi:hypothetical protein
MHAPVESNNRSPRRAVAGIGRVLLWSGGSLWIGRQAGRVERHAHHAVQVTLALDTPSACAAMRPVPPMPRMPLMPPNGASTAAPS